MIPVRNIYYMLSYAFQTLNMQGYKDVATEEFSNVAELCAAILSKGISSQIKRGLGREYIPQTEVLSSPKGRFDLTESIKSCTIPKKQMACSFDDFSVNSYMNRIIKTTAELLLRSDVSKPRKKELRKLMVFFADVETIDVNTINWKINYDRNNQTYRMLISICHLVIKGLLQSNTDGSKRLMDFLDEQRMCRLYEKFILEYYRREISGISASASQISWQLDDGNNFLLPVMQTDIMLTDKNKTLIIDAKYYSHSTVTQYDSRTLHSGNLYQIFTYVKNKAIEIGDSAHEVAGMLLYAKTDDMIHPDNQYRMSGNTISVKTLDLNCDFREIAGQLNAIVEGYFGGVEKSRDLKYI